MVDNARGRESGDYASISDPKESTSSRSFNPATSTSSSRSDDTSTGSIHSLPLWKVCLKKFEYFRKRQKSNLSIRNSFYLLNERGTNVLPKREFVDNLVSLVQSINRREAIALAEILDTRHTNSINFSCFLSLFNQEALLLESDDSTLNLVIEHPIFTDWLISRQDFQEYWQGTVTKGPPDNNFLLRILNTPSEERSSNDLQLLLKFIRYHKILSNVRENRLLDICRSLRPMHCPPGTSVITQGDPGDAFYIILSGELDVDIDGTVVNTIGSGKSFGEKALENDAPRGASVISKAPCFLMMLFAFDYKHMAASAQARQNEEITAFLHESCTVMNYLSHAKIAHIVRLASRQRFKQGEVILRQNEAPAGLLVIEAGNVSITRNLQIKTSEMGQSEKLPSVLSLTSSDPFRPLLQTDRLAASKSESTLDAVSSGYMAHCNHTVFHRQVTIATLGQGQVLGDDICRKKAHNTYGAKAMTTTDIIIINPNLARIYFKGKSLELLIKTTSPLHRSDAEHFKDHKKSVRKRRILSKIKTDALQNTTHYGRREELTRERGLPSSSLTKSSSAPANDFLVSKQEEGASFLSSSQSFDHPSPSPLPLSHSLSTKDLLLPRQKSRSKYSSLSPKSMQKVEHTHSDALGKEPSSTASLSQLPTPVSTIGEPEDGGARTDPIQIAMLNPTSINRRKKALIMPHRRKVSFVDRIASIAPLTVMQYQDSISKP